MNRLFYYNGKYYKLITQPRDLGCKNCVFDGEEHVDECENFSCIHNCGDLSDQFEEDNLTFYFKLVSLKPISIF